MQIEFEFTTSRTLDSTRLMKIPPALERAYYAQLLSISATYKQNDDIWLSWIQMGFSTAIREAPPGTAREDRIRIDTEPWDRWVKIRAESEKPHYLRGLESFVMRLDALRPSYKGKDEEARKNLLAADSEINQILYQAINSRIQELSLRPAEVKLLTTAINDPLIWLTDDEITGISSTVLS